MTINNAIKQAKENYNWISGVHEPFSVAVGFTNRKGREDETCFDLWGDNPEKELTELWEGMTAEFDADVDSVTYVEAHAIGWEG